MIASSSPHVPVFQPSSPTHRERRRWGTVKV